MLYSPSMWVASCVKTYGKEISLPSANLLFALQIAVQAPRSCTCLSQSATIVIFATENSLWHVSLRPRQFGKIIPTLARLSKKSKAAHVMWVSRSNPVPNFLYVKWWSKICPKTRWRRSTSSGFISVFTLLLHWHLWSYLFRHWPLLTLIQLPFNILVARTAILHDTETGGAYYVQSKEFWWRVERSENMRSTKKELH